MAEEIINDDPERFNDLCEGIFNKFDRGNGVKAKKLIDAFTDLALKLGIDPQTENEHCFDYLDHFNLYAKAELDFDQFKKFMIEILKIKLG